MRILHSDIRTDTLLELGIREELSVNPAKTMFLFFAPSGEFISEEFSAAREKSPLDALIRLKYVLITRVRMFLRVCQDESQLMSIAFKYNQWYDHVKSYYC